MKYPALKFTLRDLSHDLQLNESYGKAELFLLIINGVIQEYEQPFYKIIDFESFISSL